MLTLKRASKSRPGGTLSDDDYDVFDGERHVGRIMWTHTRRVPKIYPIYAKNASTLCIALFNEVIVIKQQI